MDSSLEIILGMF